MAIVVLGAAGMLGFALHRVLQDAGCDVRGTVRGAAPPASSWCRGLRYVCNVDVEDFSAVTRAIGESRARVVINATGVTVQDASGAWPRRLIAVNAVFPRQLGAAARSLGIHFIHFSSDGVFSGRQGGYDERARPDATDLYGMSKLLGEPDAENCLVLRTSLLGRGLTPKDSLLDWFLRQRGTVHGYRRALFSGLPVVEIGTMLASCVLPRAQPLTGVFHLSAASISKYELLQRVQRAWAIEGLKVEPDDSVVIDRSLNSGRLRATLGYEPPPWDELVAGMASFYRLLEASAA